MIFLIVSYCSLNSVAENYIKDFLHLIVFLKKA